MNLKLNLGDYVLDITSVEETLNSHLVIRVKSLYINRISEIHNGMKLSEWVTKDIINDYLEKAHGYVDNAPEVVYSKQPRKRLRIFNIR
jgi:hypothetical protein